MRSLVIVLLVAAAGYGIYQSDLIGGSKTGDMTTAEAMTHVQLEMTEDQVRSALGKPDTNEKVKAQPGNMAYRELTVYGYKTKDAKLAVLFADGRVTAYHRTDVIQFTR